MSFLGNLFGGGDDSDVGRTNVTTTGAIAPEAKPFVEEIFGEAQKQFKEDEFRLFPGPRIAEFDPLQQKAFTGLESLADVGLASFPSIASSAALAGQAQAAGAEGLRQLDVSDIERLSNPYQQSVIDIQKREALRDFEGATQPQVDALAVQSGSFGGSRHGVLESEAYKNLQEQLGDIQAKGSLQAYNQALAEFGRERQRQAAGAGQYAGFAQQFPSQAAKELTALQAVGETKQTRDQRALDIAFSDFLTEEAFPKQQLGQYASLIRGFPVAGRSTQEVTSLPSVPLGQQLMGLAGTGLAAYQAFAAAGGRIGSLPRGMQSGGQIRGGGLASLERHQNNTRSDPLYARLGPRPAAGTRRDPGGAALKKWLQAKARIDSLRSQRMPDEQILQIMWGNIPAQGAADTQRRRDLTVEELRSLSPENMVEEYDVRSRVDVPRPEGYISQREMEGMVLPKIADEYGVIKRPLPRDPDPYVPENQRERILNERNRELNRRRQIVMEIAKGHDPASRDYSFSEEDIQPERIGSGEGLGGLRRKPMSDEERAIITGNIIKRSDEVSEGSGPFTRFKQDDPVKESRIFDVPEGDKSKYQMGEELMREIRRGVRPLKPRRPPVDYMGPPYKTEAVFEPHGPGGAGTRIPKEMVEGRAPYNELFEMVKGRAVSPQLDEFEPAGPGGGREPYDKVAITGILEAINNPRGGRQNLMLPKELRGMEDFELRDLMETIKRNRGSKSSKIKRGPRVSDPRAGSYQQGGLISLANGGKAQSDYPALTFEESEVIDTSSPLSFIPGNAPNTARNPLDIRLNKYLTGIDEQREDLKQRRIKEDERLAGLAEKRTALSGKQEEADKTNTWLEAARMFADFGSGKNFDPRLGFFGNALAAVDFSGIKDINSDKAQRVIDELATDERLVTEAIARDSIQADENNAFSLDELRVLGVLDNRATNRAAVQSAAAQQAWENDLEVFKIKATAAESVADKEKINRGLRTKAVKYMTNITPEGWKVMAATMAGVNEDGEYINETLMDDGEVQPLAQSLFPHIQNIIAMKVNGSSLEEVQDSNNNAVQQGEAEFVRDYVTSLKKLNPKQQEELVGKFANYMEIIGYDTAKKHMKKAYDDLKITNEDDGKKYFDKENEDVTTKYYDTLITLFESVE